MNRQHEEPGGHGVQLRDPGGNVGRAKPIREIAIVAAVLLEDPAAEVEDEIEIGIEVAIDCEVAK